MKGIVRKYGWIFQLVISFILAVYIYTRLDFPELGKAFRSLPWYIILLIPAIGLMQVYITTLTQLQLFSIYKKPVTKRRTYSENFIGAFYGMALPGLVGSDLYLVNYFGKRIDSYFNAFTGIFFLRIIGLVVFVIFISLSFLFLDESTYALIQGFNLEIGAILIYAAGVFIILIAFLLIFRKKILRAMPKLLEKMLPIVNLVKLERGKTILILLLITLYYIVAIGGRAWLARIAGIDLSIMELSALIMIVNLLIMLPLSYSGIGIREGGYIGLLVLFSISKNKAVLFSMMDFSITLFNVIVGAILLLVNILLRKQSFTPGVQEK